MGLQIEDTTGVPLDSVKDIVDEELRTGGATKIEVRRDPAKTDHWIVRAFKP